MKEQDKNPRKTTVLSRDRQLSGKEVRIMIVKMIQHLGKRMEARVKKMQGVFNKDLEETKNKG